jgi:predicted DNA-binding transcriptional regulator YafY
VISILWGWVGGEVVLYHLYNTQKKYAKIKVCKICNYTEKLLSLYHKNQITMTEQKKLSRLLQMLLQLNQPGGCSISAFAKQFEITERTVYRYFDLFRDVGFVLDKHKGRYKLKSESKAGKDISELLHFSEEESYLLQQAITGIDANNGLKQSLINKLYSLYNSRYVAVSIINNTNSENIGKLVKAIDNKRQVMLKSYRSANADKVSDRIVEPLEFTTNYVSVWCYDVEKKRNQVFKTSRIGGVEEQGKAWQHEDEHQAGKTDIFRISGDETIHLHAELSLRAASLLREEYPLSEKYMMPMAENRYRLEVELYGFAGITRFALGLADEISILEPQSLKEHLNKKVKKIRF